MIAMMISQRSPLRRRVGESIALGRFDFGTRRRRRRFAAEPWRPLDAPTLADDESLQVNC
jgi:hypothetical protein